MGLIFRDKKIVSTLIKIFHDDWDAIERAAAAADPEEVPAHSAQQDAEQPAKVAKKVAKAVSKDLPPVAPVLRVVVRELVGETVNHDLETTMAEERVEDAVKEAVKEAVRSAVETVVEQNGASPPLNSDGVSPWNSEEANHGNQPGRGPSRATIQPGDIPRLVTRIFRESSRSEGSRTARVVRNLGASRFLTSTAPSTNGTSWPSRRPSANTGEEQGIDGPLFLGIDTHPLSEPAFASAMEVLAANGVHRADRAEGIEYTPTPAVSRAILNFNRGQKVGVGRRHRGHAFAQSARRRRLQVQSAARRPGRTATSPVSFRIAPTNCSKTD